MNDQRGVDVAPGLELSEEELENIRGGLDGLQDELAPEQACYEPVMPEM